MQTDVKRMLAYSAIAHTGFLLTGVLGLQASGELADGQITSLQAVLFYLTSLRRRLARRVRPGDRRPRRQRRGVVVRPLDRPRQALARWSPASFAFFLLSMAGIPLTAGFVGKWAVFTVAMSAGAWPVVLVAIASSIIAVYFYVRFIRIMFFTDPDAGGRSARSPRPRRSPGSPSPLCAAATLFLGVVPGPVLDLAVHAGDFIR